MANNLNDISKDHPEVALDICEKWYGQSKETNRIVKHACRTMLKAGNKRALLIFGYGDPSSMKVANLKLNREKLNVGDNLNVLSQQLLSAMIYVNQDLSNSKLLSV